MLRRTLHLPWLLCTALLGCQPRSSTLVDGLARYQILTPTLIRVEFSDDRQFEDGITQTRVKQSFAPVHYTTRIRDDWREIETDAMIFRFLRGSGAPNGENTTVELKNDPRGHVVMHPFAPPRVPLGGWLRSLDGRSQPPKLHDAFLSRDGYYVLDDHQTAVMGDDGWPEARVKHVGWYSDQYVFAYGHDYAHGLAELTQLTGRPPLLPRWAFGVWFSRWFPYAEGDYHELLQRFTDEKVPLDVLVVDTDWKQPLDNQLPVRSWNSWEWNQQLFPDGKRFLAWANGAGLHVTLNIHPSIVTNDPQFKAAEQRAGELHKSNHGAYVWDWGNKRQLDSYFALHAPFEDDGVRFWWLDWCCDTVPLKLPDPITADGWINSRYAERSRARGQRGFVLSRVGAYSSGPTDYMVTSSTGPWPDRRYSIHFTGDTGATWPMLGFAASFTVAEGAAGFPYVSHDIGSFAGQTLPDDYYLRWLALGVFQPILRLHSNHGKRLPWDYGEATSAAAARLLRLRESLVPYLYTLGREAFDTGLPLVRGLYFAYPEDGAAYEHPEEYLLGDALLVIPITRASGDAAAWFPPGTWTDITSGERVAGPVARSLAAPVDAVPVFARAGAIVPRQAPMAHVGERAVDPLLLDVYTGGSGQFTLYEDDGEGLAYEKGKLRRTPLRWIEDKHQLVVDAAQGSYDGAPAERSYELAIFGVGPPAKVTVDGSALAPAAFSFDDKRHVLTVRVPAHATTRPLTVELD